MFVISSPQNTIIINCAQSLLFFYFCVHSWPNLHCPSISHHLFFILVFSKLSTLSWLDSFLFFTVSVFVLLTLFFFYRLLLFLIILFFLFLNWKCHPTWRILILSILSFHAQYLSIVHRCAYKLSKILPSYLSAIEVRFEDDHDYHHHITVRKNQVNWFLILVLWWYYFT